jgi:hypothetical protein
MSRIQFVKDNFGDSALEAALKIDPTKNLKYIKWIASSLSDGSSAEDIQGTLDLYIRYKRSLEQKDIYKWKAPELEAKLKYILSKATVRLKTDSSDYDSILNTEAASLIRLNSLNSAYIHSKGTKWCIGMSGAKYFSNYSEKYIFYVLHLKKENKKFAFLLINTNDGYDIFQIFNGEDRNILQKQTAMHSITVEMLLETNYLAQLNEYIPIILEHASDNNPPLIYALNNDDDSVESYDIEFVVKFIRINKITVKSTKVPKTIKRLYRYNEKAVTEIEFGRSLNELEMEEFISNSNIIKAAISNINYNNIGLLLKIIRHYDNQECSNNIEVIIAIINKNPSMLPFLSKFQFKKLLLTNFEVAYLNGVDVFIENIDCFGPELYGEFTKTIGVKNLKKVLTTCDIPFEFKKTILTKILTKSQISRNKLIKYK